MARAKAQAAEAAPVETPAEAPVETPSKVAVETPAAETPAEPASSGLDSLMDMYGMNDEPEAATPEVKAEPATDPPDEPNPLDEPAGEPESEVSLDLMLEELSGLLSPTAPVVAKEVQEEAPATPEAPTAPFVVPQLQDRDFDAVLSNPETFAGYMNHVAGYAYQQAKQDLLQDPQFWQQVSGTFEQLTIGSQLLDKYGNSPDTLQKVVAAVSQAHPDLSPKQKQEKVSERMDALMGKALGIKKNIDAGKKVDVRPASNAPKVTPTNSRISAMATENKPKLTPTQEALRDIAAYGSTF